MIENGYQHYPAPAAVDALFDKLPTTRLYCHLDGRAHGYTHEFVTLAAAWFRLYA